MTDNTTAEQMMTSDEAKSHLARILRDQKALLLIHGILEAATAAEADATALAAKVEAAQVEADAADARLAAHLARVAKVVERANGDADKAILAAEDRIQREVSDREAAAKQALLDLDTQIKADTLRLACLLQDQKALGEKIASREDVLSILNGEAAEAQAKLDAINKAIASVTGGIKA